MALPDFDVEALEGLAYSLVGCPRDDGFTVVSREVVDEKRWAIVKRTVFGYDGRFFAMTYETPATEEQEIHFEPEVVEVFPVERVVTFYEPAPAEVAG